MHQMRSWGISLAEEFFKGLQLILPYRIGYREYSIPQGQVRCTQGILHLLRNGRQYQEPLHKLYGRVLRGDGKGHLVFSNSKKGVDLL